MAGGATLFRRSQIRVAGMIRPILKYGAPELVQVSEPIEDFDDELKELANDLLETMYAAPGIGLAAPQVGVNRRLIVVDVTSGQEKDSQLVLVNPKVTHKEGSQKGEEGCLSIPGFSAVVVRPMEVEIEACDVEGRPVRVRASELQARALCHEIDHLDGILYLDRVSALKRDLIKRKIRKLVRAGEW